MVLVTRRRAKHSKPLKERKESLTDLPLDVLIEIFLFLEPLDLLNLSRTSKELRGFLLNRRKASALWKNVISNVKDFPPCPDHISAPAYAHLAFVSVCHGCFHPCETIEWELRMRCCPDCFPKMTIPRCSIHNKTRTYLNALKLPTAYNHCKMHHPPCLDSTVFFEVVDSPFSFSRLDWKAAQSCKRPRNVSIEEFQAQQNGYWESIRRHARLCQEWEYGKLKERAAQLSLVRQQRVKDIKNKLKESGWTDDNWTYSYEYALWQLPEVRKLEPLTATEWTKIRPELIGWARKTRRDLIGNLCASTISLIIQQELRSDASLKVQPQGIDIAMLPAVRSVLERDMLKNDINTDTICDDLKKKLFRALPPAIRRWSSDTVEELEQFAREQLCLPLWSKPSCLPSVIFQCKRCSRSVKQRSRFRFDEALSHDHLYREKYSGTRGKHSVEMSPYDKLLMKYHMHPRNILVLQVDITVSHRVENLIRRMGQNPTRVTYDELRRSTVKVICGLCRPEVANSMNFERAFDHCLSTHVGDKKTEVWIRASGRE